MPISIEIDNERVRATLSTGPEREEIRVIRNQRTLRALGPEASRKPAPEVLPKSRRPKEGRDEGFLRAPRATKYRVYGNGNATSGLKAVGTGVLSSYSEYMYPRTTLSCGMLNSMVPTRPKSVTGPGLSRIPAMGILKAPVDSTSPFRPINVSVRFELIFTILTSSQQMNAVEVDSRFSRGLQKRRFTNVGKLNALDLTSSVRRVKEVSTEPWFALGKRWYLTVPMIVPVSAL